MACAVTAAAECATETFGGGTEGVYALLLVLFSVRSGSRFVSCPACLVAVHHLGHEPHVTWSVRSLQPSMTSLVRAACVVAE